MGILASSANASPCRGYKFLSLVPNQQKAIAQNGGYSLSYKVATTYSIERGPRAPLQTDYLQMWLNRDMVIDVSLTLSFRSARSAKRVSKVANVDLLDQRGNLVHAFPKRFVNQIPPVRYARKPDRAGVHQRLSLKRGRYCIRITPPNAPAGAIAVHHLKWDLVEPGGQYVNPHNRVSQ
ncbi:MAG: hypothetical protein AAF755_12505 [Pseudomonadota bacterium]